MRTFEGDTTNLPEGVDPEKARKSVQRWYGEYGLPADLLVVEKDFDIRKAVYADQSIGKDYEGFTYKEPFFIRDGYLMVNFDIETVKGVEQDLDTVTKENLEEKRELSYGKYSANADMWKIEGDFRHLDDEVAGIRNKRPRKTIGKGFNYRDLYEDYQEPWTFYYGDIVTYNLKFSINNDWGR